MFYKYRVYRQRSLRKLIIVNFFLIKNLIYVIQISSNQGFKIQKGPAGLSGPTMTRWAR